LVHLVFECFCNLQSLDSSPLTSVAAAIIEHRPLYNLPHVLLNFLEVLPDAIMVYFFCSSESATLVQSTLRDKMAISKPGRIIYIEGYFGELRSVSKMTKIVYNRLLLDHAFWEIFERAKKDSVIIFESDTFLCKNPSTRLEVFMKYGYIGAPWVRRECKTCKIRRLRHARNKLTLPVPVGNSGLSMMKTKIMLNMTSSVLKEKTKRLQMTTILRGGCDVYISTVLQDKMFSYLFNARVAPVHVASLFSVESLYDGYYVPFGGHAPCTFADALKGRCPQAQKACLLLKNKVGDKTWSEQKLQ